MPPGSEEERPFTYIDKNRYGAPHTIKLAMQKGDRKQLQAYIHITEKQEGTDPIGPFIDQAWAMADKKYAKVIPAEKVWEYGVRYAKESLWAEENEYRGFSIGLLPNGQGGWKQRPFVKYEIGWCGQNSSYINSLLVDYLRGGNIESKEKALAAIDTWTAPPTLRPTGFYTTSYDDILAGRTTAVSDACNLGTAAYNFFEASVLIQP